MLCPVSANAIPATLWTNPRKCPWISVAKEDLVGNNFELCSHPDCPWHHWITLETPETHLGTHYPLYEIHPNDPLPLYETHLMTPYPTLSMKPTMMTPYPTSMKPTLMVHYHLCETHPGDPLPIIKPILVTPYPLCEIHPGAPLPSV